MTLGWIEMCAAWSSVYFIRFCICVNKRIHESECDEKKVASNNERSQLSEIEQILPLRPSSLVRYHHFVLEESAVSLRSRERLQES